MNIKKKFELIKEESKLRLLAKKSQLSKKEAQSEPGGVGRGWRHWIEDRSEV